jgi:aspartyl protease family protein
MNRLFILVMSALGLTLALLIWNHDTGTIAGIANEDFASVVMLGCVLASLVAGGFWYKGSLQGTLRDVALWLAIFAALGALYQFSPAVQAFMAR